MKYLKAVYLTWAILFGCVSLNAAYNDDYKAAWRALAVCLLWLSGSACIKGKD